MSQLTHSARRLANKLRKQADGLEGLASRIVENKTELVREQEHTKLMLQSRKGICPPWDLTHSGGVGGYDYRDGGKGEPSKEVIGQGWDVLCSCPNKETASFIAHALNEYLKIIWPEIMKQGDDAWRRGRGHFLTNRRIKAIIKQWKREIKAKKSNSWAK